MPSEDSNQLAHPYSLIRFFLVRMKKLHPWLSKCAQWRFWSDCANTQAIWIFAVRTCPKVRFLIVRCDQLNFSDFQGHSGTVSEDLPEMCRLCRYKKVLTCSQVSIKNNMFVLFVTVQWNNIMYTFWNACTFSCIFCEKRIWKSDSGSNILRSFQFAIFCLLQRRELTRFAQVWPYPVPTCIGLNVFDEYFP